MKIYLARNNVQAGPYSLDELNTMLASGEVVLDDLAWHSGMSDWQRLGDLTHNQTVYRPHATTSAIQRGFGDNVDFYQPNQPSRTSVDELYGRETPAPIIIQKKQTPTTTYASISARFMAFLINICLYILALLPALMAFLKTADLNKMSTLNDYASLQAYTQTLAQQIDTTTLAMSNLMLFALFAIQLLLIMMRGQSFGKMVIGICVLDANAAELPNLSTLLLRTLLLISLYIAASFFASGLLAVIMLATNYLMASNHPKKQGWHDRLTKTTVAYRPKSSQQPAIKKDKP